MSDHNDQCRAQAMLPVALGRLDHVHEFHNDGEITSYTGQGNCKSDIYIVSGSAREKKFRELRDSLNEKSTADVEELERIYNQSHRGRPRAAKTTAESNGRRKGIANPKKPANS